MSLRNFSVPSITVAGVIVPPPFATFPLLCVSLSHAPDAHTTSRVRGECHGGIVPTILIRAADDLASFLRYPLGQFFTRGDGRDAADQTDGHGSSTTGTVLQNDHRPPPPRPVPGGLDGESRAQAQDNRARFRCPSYDRGSLAQALSRTWRGGLTDPLGPGQPGRIPETLASTLQTWVKDGPQSCGLDRANWTYEELATYLSRTTGIAVKCTAMRVFCQRHDIRPYLPTYRYLRGNPEKQQAAQAELAALKKSAGGGVRVVEPRRSALSTGPDAPRHPRREGLSAHGGDMG